MLRVGFDETGLELETAGTARAALGLRDALERRDDVEVVPLAQAGSGGRLARGLSRELLWYPVRLPRRTTGLDVLHCPFPLAPPWAAAPVVLTLHDAIPWDTPAMLTRANVLHARTVLRVAARRAARLLAPSEHAADRIAAAVGVPRSRISVTPWGVGPAFSPGPANAALLERAGVRPPYLLTVGTLQPRKNLQTAIAAFERAGCPEHQLVLTGVPGWGNGPLDERRRSSPVADRIVATGRVDEATLVALYRAADCLLMPSRSEGFGLPVLEAMACGTPVICSTAGALPEVAGDAAALVAPDDVDGLAAAIGELPRDDLVRRGLARAAAFTWERCAELTVAAYRSVV